MKIIEKTCPNCGANIEFNKGDEKVKCEYCKKTYVIEEEKEDYRLVLSKQFTNMFMIIFVFSFAFIVLVGFLIAIGVGNGAKKLIDSQVVESSKPINSFDDISSETISAIHKKSAEVLNNDSNITSFLYEQKEPFENKGMYLLIFDGGSTLYDVYMAKYEIKGTVKDIYTAIRYEDVNKNAKNLYGSHLPNTNPSSETFMIGYSSMEELYNNTVKVVKADKILATEGLYTENA